MKKFLERVSKEENLDIDDEAYKAVIYASEGDMRKAINMLQTASMAREKVTEETIYSVTSRADPLAVRKMITHAMEGNFREARKSLLALMFEQGLAGEDIIKEIHSQVFELDMPDIRKINLIEKVGECEFRLTEGSNAQIQLEALLAQFGVVKKD